MSDIAAGTRTTSSLTAARTPATEKEFGRPKTSRGKSAFPQVLAVALVSTQTREIMDVAFGRFTES